MDGRILEVRVTCGSLKEAKRIALSLLKERLVICSNINETESMYEWKGNFEDHAEWTLILKSTDAAYPKVEKRIKEMHSYEMPAIVAIPILNAYEPYRKLVVENVKP
ncbi:MAG: divalent-cation tolerance protein CutA [Candidatus Micrarchaeota archaeon]